MAKTLCIVTFASTHLALRAERAMRTTDMQFRMMTVPRRVSADCTMGMAIEPDCKQVVEELMTNHAVECRIVDWNVN